MNYSKLEMKIYKTVSFGKILISSEYFVLKGALALAIPTKFKQSQKNETLSNFRNNILGDCCHFNFQFY